VRSIWGQEFGVVWALAAVLVRPARHGLRVARPGLAVLQEHGDDHGVLAVSLVEVGLIGREAVAGPAPLRRPVDVQGLPEELVQPDLVADLVGEPQVRHQRAARPRVRRGLVGHEAGVRGVVPGVLWAVGGGRGGLAVALGIALGVAPGVVGRCALVGAGPKRRERDDQKVTYQ
jgi:hypothetical protein